MSSQGSSINGTPAHERQSSSPLSLRPPQVTSAFSLPTSSASTAHPTTHPITLEALLSHHANASDPTLNALDQVLSERNLFSSQNTQLWKLIEKQRSGYNQVLKELERMRVERDTYKARLQAAGINFELGKKDKERIKPSRPSLSSTTMSTTSENDSTDPRAESIRQQVETSALINRSDDRPASPPQQAQDVNGRELHVLPSDGPMLPILAPVVVPPRTASLPSKTTTLSTPSSESPSQLDEAEKAIYTSRGSATPASLQDSAAFHFGSLQQAAAPSSLLTDGNASFGSHSQPPPVQPPTIQRPYIHATVSPQTSARSPDSISKSAQFTNAHATHLALLSPNMVVGASPGMLSPIPENGRKLSRESRVSLPDEAKRYIANMGESPMQSPGLQSEHSRARAGRGTERSDMGSPNKLDRGGAGCGGDESEFMDMDEAGDEENEQQQQLPLVINRQAKSYEVDDFPMPPSHGHAQSSREPSAPDATSSPQMSWPPQSEMLSQPQSSQDPQLSMPQPESPTPESYLSPVTHTHGFSSSPTYHALPLVPDDLRTTHVTVSHSSIKPNDRGKEVLSFEINVDPGRGKEPWKVQKLYSDVLALDQRFRAAVGKSASKKIGTLPEGKLWRDHAPAKSDQRKASRAALEAYLRSLIELPVKNRDEVIAFFTSDIVRDTKKPVMQAGYKEGYLTKRGKNFGGWKTRYFVLQGPVLEYYESRGGAHLGSIVITNAQIGRQQRTTDNDDEKNYRHAFLIIEAKKGPAGSNPRHVLCAESDSERDSWVNILVRYVTGTFNEDSLASVSAGLSPISVNVPQSQSLGSGQPRASISSNQESVTTPNGKRATRTMSKDDISRGAAIPLSQLPQDTNNAKLFQTTLLPGSGSFDESYSASPTKSVYTVNTDGDQSIQDRVEPPLSSSLPTNSPLDAAAQGLVAYRPNSELGHYSEADRQGAYPKQEQGTPDSARSQQPRRDRKSFHPGLAAVSGSPTMSTFPDHAPSPDSVTIPSQSGDINGRVKISGPMSGVPIPAGYKFGGKDPSEGTSSSDRREKAKSRSFWNFGRPVDKPPTSAPRVVFGVPLEESLEVTEIARLPAVVFRCIQYLEAKKADQEEGIYRLSGSSAVIKGLKDRFNLEGDVDLLASDEYWDLHAIAGLLKSFLRELPASILTRDLHMKFLSVMDFVEPQERIRELSHLIALLPIANYTLLRALTAHLILIVQNSGVNKMTMRNVGIVFSPTLGIPAGVFSLMLGEFNRVFNVDAANDTVDAEEDREGELSRRNSRQYSDAAADRLLGLSGRTLHAPSEETPSEDGDIVSLQYESGNETTENETTVESMQTRSSGPSQNHSQHATDFLSPPRLELTPMESRSRASNVAASRGLNIAVNKKINRQSRMTGLPTSPRPPPDAPRSPASSPLTARQS